MKTSKKNWTQVLSHPKCTSGQTRICFGHSVINTERYKRATCLFLIHKYRVAIQWPPLPYTKKMQSTENEHVLVRRITIFGQFCTFWQHRQLLWEFCWQRGKVLIGSDLFAFLTEPSQITNESLLSHFICVPIITSYDEVADVAENHVQFASKILMPRRMHWNCFQTA